MAHKAPSHYFRRGNVFYFRQPIPRDIRHHFPTNEICFSLHTEISTVAARHAIELSGIIANYIWHLRNTGMNENNQNDPTRGRDLIETLKLKREQIKQTMMREEYEDAAIDMRIEHLRDKKAIQKAHAEVVARQQADHAATIATMVTHQAQVVAEIATRQAVAGVPPSLPATPPSMRLSEAIELVTASKKARGKWTDKTEAENKAVYDLLVRILGDRPIAEIGSKAVTSYVNTLRNLPANMNKIPRFIGKSIEEILAMAPEPMSLRTTNKHIERASSLFKLLLRDPSSGITHNPFEGQTVEAKRTGDEKKREPFTSTELIALLCHESFKARTFNNPYTYWAIPLALFTGARLNEIAQLHLGDFVEVDGVKCIDINDDESEEGEDAKKLKTKNAKRLVPLHDELIRLGIWNYTQALKAAGYTRLFPEINKRRDGYGPAISNWFQRHRAACGINEKHTKVFHSFRHTVITTLLDEEVPMEQVAPLVGHETGIVTGDVYWNKKDATKRKRTIDKLVYPSEIIAMIPTIHDVKLNAYGHGTFWLHGKVVNRVNFDNLSS